MNVPTSLQALIYQSFGECEIEEMSPSLCDKCKTNKYYERFTEILEMPKYLIVHLHRFKEIMTTNHRYMRVKDSSKVIIDNKINFTNCKKRLHNALSSNDTEYELYGVVHHSGSIDSGHYIW